MKRKFYILAILLSLFSVTAFAQSLSLSNSSGNITNDQLFRNDFDTTTLYHDYDDFNVKNNTGLKIQVMVKKVYLEMCPDTKNFMCWGLCTEDFIAGPLEIPANGTNTDDFSCHYDPRGKTGTSLVRYVFYKEGSPQDSVCFRMRYNHPFDVGIKEINNNYTFSNAFPNPASNLFTVNYSYSSEVTDAAIVVADLMGKVVRNIPLNNNQGKITINTTDMANGIYIYSLRLNGRIVNTKKLVVNH
jgi:hypothetical protein